jgi:hypothetical protein
VRHLTVSFRISWRTTAISAATASSLSPASSASRNHCASAPAGGTQADRLTVAVKPGGGTELLKKIMHLCAQDPRMPQLYVLSGHLGGPAAAVRVGAADVAILRTPPLARGRRLRPRGRRSSG